MTDVENRTRSSTYVGVGWGIHLFTCFGIVCGVLSLEAALGGHVKPALLWLLATQVIDGVDGPIARALRVELRVARVDGYLLDLVIDYVTCVIVPTVLLHKFELLPSGVPSFLGEAAIVCSGAIWFSRTDMCTEDHHFRGFPAEWNLVVTSFMLLHMSQWTNFAATALLAVLSLTGVLFVHVVRVVKGRTLTIAVFTLWLAAMGWSTIRYPDTPGWARLVLIASPLYYVGLAVKRTVEVHRQSKVDQPASAPSASVASA